MTVAIFDDIGVILIIGIFYGEESSTLPLLISIGATAFLILMNAYEMTGRWGYVIGGLVLWVALGQSGLEASLAGIIISLSIPMRAKYDHHFSPVRVLEERLQPVVALGIIPLFAYLNAGVVFDEPISSLISAPAPLGILLGLVLGKQLGIFSASLVVVRFGLGKLPAGVTWGQVYGASLLAGIGFTMSLFIATLAFEEDGLIASAKVAVLIASLLSAATGLAVLYMTTSKKRLLPTAQPN